MDFFEHQDRARRATGVLVVLFVVAVLLIVGATYLASVLALRFAGVHTASLWAPQLLLGVGGGVTALVAIASSTKTLSLRRGGEAVAEMVGGKLVNPDTTDTRQRRLVNVVQEMALASGAPVPLIYVLEKEDGINAFAAGNGPEDAVVAVTNGTLNALSRDELQGVVAHEFSHILNRDVRLNVRLVGLLYGILVIGLTGRLLLRFSGRSVGGNRKGAGNAAILIGLALFIVGYVGVFAGRLIQRAVSRQREYLADASAVQFTRNPIGLANALKTIGGWQDGSQVGDRAAEEISHFFFADGLKRHFAGEALSTHPPLAERIRRLDPSFDGTYATAEAVTRETADHTVPSGAISLNSSAPVAATPESVMDDIGVIESDRFIYDDALRVEIPATLREHVATSFGAVTITYALLLDQEETRRTAQLDLLAGHVIPAIYEETVRWQDAVHDLPLPARLPLLDLAAPALRQLSDGQQHKLVTTVEVLVEADEHLSLFEYCAHTLLRHRLGRDRRKTPRVNDGAASAVVLSTVAAVGHTTPEERVAAYKRGRDNMGAFGRRLAETPVSANAKQLDAALLHLADARLATRKALVQGCTYSALSDEDVTLEEAELLRVVVVALGFPLPPFLPQA